MKRVVDQRDQQRSNQKMGGHTVTLTTQVKEELARVTVSRPSSRRAEVSALARFTATIHTVSGQVLVEFDVDSDNIARRLQTEIDDLYHRESTIHTTGSASGRKGTRYLVRVVEPGFDFARKVGLVTRGGQYIRGLSPTIVSGTVSDAEAAWRGAFLACGSLTEPGRSSALEVTCPCAEAALALVGCARRLGISAKTKETRGADRVSIRENEAIGALLTRMGAQQSRLEWEEQRQRREVRSPASRLANFDDANLRRSARAAVGEDVPDHLAEAGHLRVTHRQASLEELGRLADPQMTKDAVAGRIRRLLTMADKRAKELGIPATDAAVTDDLLEDM